MSCDICGKEIMPSEEFVFNYASIWLDTEQDIQAHFECAKAFNFMTEANRIDWVREHLESRDETLKIGSREGLSANACHALNGGQHG